MLRQWWIGPLVVALLQSKFDSYFGCSTVGSVITIFIHFYFAAYYYALSKYKIKDEENNDKYFLLEINNYKYLLAILWGLINLYALEGHLKDPYWGNGSAFSVMLCNPFLSPFFETFRAWYLSNSSLYFTICKIASFAYIAMQALMIPFFIFRKTRFLFYISMFCYISGITFFIDTSFLAHFAWLLFILLLPTVTLKDSKIKIYPSALKLLRPFSRINYSYSVVILLFVLINTPIIDNYFKKVVWLFREWDTYKLADKKLKMIGLGKANLFNAYQIDGGHKWFAIYKHENNNWELVPIMDTTGRKLTYGIDFFHTCNHGSDFLWLANTFQYAIGQEKMDYTNSLTPYKLPGTVYERLLRFDFNKYSKLDEKNYKIKFYSNLRAKGTSNPFKASLDSTMYYYVNKNTIQKYTSP
ncbi:MAG: hypothetical protein PSX81_13650 [bacterium]|nr:hypothetical protein [bacterium]